MAAISRTAETCAASLPAPLLWLDGTGRVVGMTEQLATQLGVRPADWIGQTLSSRVVGSMRARASGFVRAAATGSAEVVVAVPDPAGPPREARLVATGPDPHGLIAVGFTLVDGAHRARRLQTVLERTEGASVVPFEIDGDPGRQWWGPGLDRLLGGSSRGGTGLDRVLAALVPDDRRRLEGVLRRSRITRRDLDATGRLAGTAEPGSWVRLQAGWVPGVDGPRLAGQLTEVTALRRAELALDHATRLASAGELASGLAHDFNNLLSVVLSNADMVRSTTQGADNRAAMDDVIEAAERAAELVRRLLAVARPRPTRPERVDLRERVRHFATMARAALGPTMTLEVELGAEPMPVVLDPVLLDTALLNLCLNARDALEACGRVRLSLARRTTADAGHDLVAVTVADRGPGIPPSVLDRLFEPFVTTKGEGGTGLGLAMVRRFARMSGGRLHVATEAGAGTAVTLLFPLCQASRATPHAHAPRRVACLSPLVSEDARQALEAARVSVVTCDGVPALRRELQQDRLDGILVPWPGPPGLLHLLLDLVRAPGAPPTLLMEAESPTATPPPRGFPRLRRPWTAPDLVDTIRELIDADRDTPTPITAVVSRSGGRLVGLRGGR
jgi:signal transduction histidine kinase